MSSTSPVEQAAEYLRGLKWRVWKARYKKNGPIPEHTWYFQKPTLAYDQGASDARLIEEAKTAGMERSTDGGWSAVTVFAPGVRKYVCPFCNRNVAGREEGEGIRMCAHGDGKGSPCKTSACLLVFSLDETEGGGAVHTRGEDADG